MLTDARVLGIEFNGCRASGVRARLDSVNRRFACNGEVSLAAGAVGSPQLLLPSGVGPAGEIARFGVSPVPNASGIGTNLLAHLEIHNAHRVRNPTLNQRLDSVCVRVWMWIQFALRCRGPLAMGAAAIFAFPVSAPWVDRADIQFHCLPWSSDNPGKGFHEFPGFTISICPTRPESHSEIRLKSPDPMDPPAIQANCLSTERDRRTTVAGLLKAREICRRAPVSDQIEEELWPGPGLAEAGNAALLKGIKERVTTISRLCGTVAIGEGRPLDERCRVGSRGIEGGRYFGHAFDSLGQHQRGSEHDCREGE